MQFVIASHNKKKITEMSDILSGLGIEIVALPEGAPEPEENGTTFAENACIKARAAFEFTGLPAIADDSGLAVDALGGAPGVFSARYCEGTDKDRNAFLLKNMENVPDGERTGRFVCAICCVLDKDREIVVEGACDGIILREERGEGGFGYDPLFFVEQFGCTFGEVPAESKHTISHRGRALRKLEQKLREEKF